MPLAPNSRLGPYEIKSTLGVGGMGEVYRARDSRLNRDVAIKVLRSDSTATPEIKSRFEREARAVAALNHPNIVSVFDFGIDKVDGAEAQYIVSELIEGESLRHVIAGKPLPTRRLVDIAVQIADGLAAAHAGGIVHRDLKPENILVTKDGRAKILDFGLARQSAKTVPANSSDETYAPETKDHLTSAGTVLGTASYMSPEQAVGKETDYRSDQFSFGLILHEMATGKQAFARNSSVETMAAIVRDEPPPIEQKLPAPLKWIIDRCLNKELEQRYESTRDLYRDLKNLRDHFSEAYSPSGVLAPVPAKVRPVRLELLVLSAAACLLLGSAVTYLLKPYGQNIAKYRYTPFASDASSAVWSPDGKAVAYSGKVTGIYQVFLRYLNSPLSVQLTHEKHNVWPLGWSSDRAHLIVSEEMDRKESPLLKLSSVATVGGDLEFVMDSDCDTCDLSRDGKALATLIKRNDYFGIAISDPLGSPLREYTPAPFATKELYEASRIAFSPDGKNILFCRQGESGVNELWRLPYPMGSGVPERILHNRLAFSGDAMGSWTPDNRHIVFSFTTPESPRRHLAIADTRSEDFVQLTAGTSNESEPVSSPDGKSILYTQDGTRGNVVSVSLADGSTNILISTSNIESAPGWAANQAKLAWSSDRSGHSEIWLRALDGSERPAVRLADGPPGAEVLLNPSLSPDGGRVAYVAWTVQGNVQGLWLWISSLSGGLPVRLTNAEKEFEYGGSWSPDGSRIAYIQTRNNILSLMVVKTSGNAVPITLKQNVDLDLPDWSPDGNWITYHDKQGWSLISPDGKKSKPLGKIETPYLVFSRDGKLLYGIQTGETEFDEDRATLFSLDPATLKRLVIKELGTEFLPASAVRLGVRFSLAPDGKSLAFSTLKRQHDLWMLQGYSQPGLWNQLTSAFSR